MKTCPFCREQIHDEALKCRYCCSRLVAEPLDQKPAAPHEKVGPDQVVYILDRDLIRFAKFAGAMLAIFVTVGVSIWGFDITKAAKEVHESRNQARTIQTELNKTKDDIQLAKETILAASGEINANRAQTRALLVKAENLGASIFEKEQQATVFFARIVERSSAVNEPSAGFSVPDLAKLYCFPPELTGAGQTIGIIELGGGYIDADLDAYFADLKLPRPKVTSISVLGSTNQPNNGQDGIDEQVTMDVEVAAAVAPGANIVVYFVPNDPDSFTEGVRTAVYDDVNRPTVLLISWGSPEKNWARSAMVQMDQVLQIAAQRNITVVSAVGNTGVTDGVSDGLAHVDFPASSPWVLACGGTRLTASAGTISSETVWNEGYHAATGGGVSRHFLTPDWQRSAMESAKLGLTGRGVPDVVAHASPSPGYRLFVHGNRVVLGGTSAATPLWAGLIALLNQGCGRNVGNFNEALYSTIGPAGMLRGISDGGASMANATDHHWNAFTGWGSPNGQKLLEAFRSVARKPE